MAISFEESFVDSQAPNANAIGMPCFGCTPKLLPALIEGCLRGQDLRELAKRVESAPKKH